MIFTQHEYAFFITIKYNKPSINKLNRGILHKKKIQETS